MPASELLHMVRRALIKKISILTDIGDVPYDMIRPVLLKIENPNQLKSLEEASPQLYGADAEIWISLIKRDVPKAEEKMMYPRNPKSWWKVYRKMLNDHQKEVEEDAMKLKNAYNGIKEAKKPPPAIMEGVPHIPKLGGMERAHLLEHNQCYAKKRQRKAKPVLSVQRYGAKELTGKGVMEKIRRETMEQSQKRKSMSNPMDRLNSLVSQVPVAPRHMVEQYQKSQAPKPLDPNIPKRATLEPPPSKISDDDRPRVSAAELMDQQNRQHIAQMNLAKAAKAGTSTPPATSEKAPNYWSQSARPEKRVARPQMEKAPGSFMNVFTGSSSKKRRLA
ncbi:MAG: hypothetical protein L6R38_004577 [Xanthoria sp. 2 TBL-2021]|nr:MAG: hypothetical protein L6R38_004577 [Xanthoria sp. 2 TBL-2021]